MDVSLEVRERRDPYTVFAEAHYNIGRDMDYIYWLSALSLFLAAALVLGLLGLLVIVRKNAPAEIERRRL